MNSLGAESGTDLALREALPLVRTSTIASLSHRTDRRLTKLPVPDLPSLTSAIILTKPPFPDVILLCYEYSLLFS
jgi:hypothetical protein